MRQTLRTFATNPVLLVWAGGIVLGLAMGSRHVQGLFLLPMSTDRHWTREVFSFAIALQALIWGIMQPVTGALTDRFGSAWIIVIGCVTYAVGLFLQAGAETGPGLAFGQGGVIGIALTATTFATIYGALSKLASPATRTQTLGVAGAVGGMIQFVLVPLTQKTIAADGWQSCLHAVAWAFIIIAPLGFVLNDRPVGAITVPTKSFKALLLSVKSALRHRGFWLLNAGFVSCGFQLAFLGVHLPAYLRDKGMNDNVAVVALAIIAFFNAVGTYACGRLGDIYRCKYVLAAVYAIRTLSMVVFLVLPVSPWSVYAFAAVMGATWLGTVPLTSGVLSRIFGVGAIATLFGLVFLGHQLGGFFGAWLAGYLYDLTHSYDAIWAISIGLCVASVLLNIPINDLPISERKPALGALA